jgi:hypothetical protein
MTKPSPYPLLRLLRHAKSYHVQIWRAIAQNIVFKIVSSSQLWDGIEDG